MDTVEPSVVAAQAEDAVGDHDRALRLSAKSTTAVERVPVEVRILDLRTSSR
jgi:hypothetical protein